MGGKNAKKKFSKNTRLGYPKLFGKKNRLEKVRKHVFYTHTNIVTKNGRKKTRQKNFSRITVYRELKTMENNRLEKVRKHVFL